MSLSDAGGTGGVIALSFLKTYSYTWNGIPPLVIICLARFIGVSYNIDTNTYPYTNITVYSLGIFPQNCNKFLG